MRIFIQSILLLLLNVGVLGNLRATQLVMIKSSEMDQTRKLIDNPAIAVHYYTNNFVLATVDFLPKESHIILDENPWRKDMSYYVVYANEFEASSFLANWSNRLEVLHKADGFLIVATNEVQYGQLKPARNDGMIRIHNQLARLPQTEIGYNNSNRNPDPFIEELMAQVSHENITATVQHLQDYGTRNAYHANSVEAQNWIADQFTAMGLEVEIMDFSMPSGAASDNVIATLPGTKYPNEYVICGGHYDSYTYSGLAPGADDNASGTAGVLEIARILSQYEFDRTLVFGAWSGEEYGLYGSAAYAARAAQMGMDIHGYFNLDMIGYLKPGNTTIKTTLIYPASAEELADFYEAVCATYLPEFVIEDGALSGGDSDHTSFNNNGFMGIFPFEAVPDYSPYIHTSNDIIGPSYNNAEMAGIFTQASLASVVTMSNRLLPPRGLTALAGDMLVDLEWTSLVEAASYNIYRNGTLIDNITDAGYTDTNVENGTLYTYYITAIYTDSGLESDPSNSVTATPMPPLVLPLSMDFESGTPYWEFTETWGISTAQAHSPSHSITESPTGSYQNDVTSFAYLRPFSLNMGFTDAELRFWTRYDMETNYDYMYLEVSTNGQNWTQLATYNGVQNNWQQKTYSLNTYLGQEWVQLRFRFESDYTVTKDGMYIDDFEIVTEGGGMMFFSALLNEGWNSLSSYIQPQNANLDQLFAPVSNKLIAVQSVSGLYYPQQGINTIGLWDEGTGYKVKMSGPASLMISGPETIDGSLVLQQGWNLMPVLSACTVDFMELIQPHIAEIEMARNLTGSQVYWPETGLEGLSQLEVGKAYMIMLTQSITIDFPDCTKANASMLVDPSPALTSTAHNLAFAADVFSFAQPGDQIYAFTTEGTAAGSLVINEINQPHYMAVFGNDSLNTVLDGFLPNEAMQLKWLQSGTGFYYDLDATYNPQMPNQGLYTHDGMSHISALVPDAVGVTENKMLLSLYPNPAADYVLLQTQGAKILNVDLIYPSGKQMQLHITSESNNRIDVSSLTAGVYILSVKTEKGIRHLKFVKE